MRFAASAILIITALLLAGCGAGGSSPGVANLSSAKTATNATASSSAADAGAPVGGGGPALGGSAGGGNGGGFHASIKMAGASGAQELKFAQCMRANGEPSFPDPDAQGAFEFNSSAGAPGTPQFQAAQRKCAKYTPHGGQPPSPAQTARMQAQALAYAQCMRAHGVPDFPDPTFSGGGVGFHIAAGSGSSLDPNSPIFQKAQKACQDDLPGGGPGGP